MSLEKVIPLWREGKTDFESGWHGELFLFISALQTGVAKIFSLFGALPLGAKEVMKAAGTIGAWLLWALALFIMRMLSNDPSR